MAVKLVDLRQNQSVAAGAGLTFDPGLRDMIPNVNPLLPPVETAVAPDIIIPIPKATGSNCAVTTALAVGNQTVTQGAVGAIVYDILSIRFHTIQRLIAASLLQVSSRLRYFVIADAGNDASRGAVYADALNLTNLYTVLFAKVAGDTVTVLVCERQTGGVADSVIATGTLNLISGTGDATIAWLAPGIEFEKYVNVNAALAIANGGGTTVNPALALLANGNPGTIPPGTPLMAPQIVVPVAKALPAALTNQAFVATAMGVGNITIQHAEGAPVSMDVLGFDMHTMQSLLAAQAGIVNDRRRYFIIANATNASVGAVYTDNALATRIYTVTIAKVSGDGSTLLTTVRNSGTPAESTANTGTLNLSSGTGDATINWLSPTPAAASGVLFEKYSDIQNAVSVPAGAGGLDFNPNLVVNGARVMPHIVIVVPKATGCVPFVTTDLAGAVALIHVQHNNGGAINCDILSFRILPEFFIP